MYIIQQSACERFFFCTWSTPASTSTKRSHSWANQSLYTSKISKIWYPDFFCWLHLYQIPLVSPQNNASCFDLPGVSYRKVDPTHALGALAVAVEPTWRGCTWGLGCWRRPSSFLRLGSVYQHSGREFIFSTVQVSRKQVVGRRTYVASFCCYLELGTFSETRV